MYAIRSYYASQYRAGTVAMNQAGGGAYLQVLGANVRDLVELQKEVIESKHHLLWTELLRHLREAYDAGKKDRYVREPIGNQAFVGLEAFGDLAGENRNNFV